MAHVISGGSLASTHTVGFRPFGARTSLDLYGRVRDYAELYRRQPNVRLVVRFLARNIASLGLKPYRRVSKTERIELDNGHPLRQFLRNPTPALPVKHGRHHWIRGIVEDLAVYDALFLLKMRNAASAELNAVRIPPTRMRPDGEELLYPERFILHGNRGEREYATDAVVYMHGHDPADPTAGISPLEALRLVLAEDLEASVWRAQYWRNSARISGVLTRPAELKPLSDPAFQRLQSTWQAAYSGNGDLAGSTPILEEGVQFKETAFSAVDSEYLGSRRLTREECAAAYFIPPVFVGILENANFANIKEQHVSLYADTLGPWLDWLTEELELQLLPEFPDVDDVYLEFNIDEKLRGRFEERAAIMQTATGAPWLTRNEARALDNRAPLPGGDDLVVPLNVLIGGQASPTDSAPTGAMALARGRAAYGPAGTKAAVPSYLRGWEAKHVEVLTGFFMRQSESVLAKLGAGQDLPDAFQLDRWNGELATDFFALALAMSEEVGGAVAEDFGAEYDIARAEAWLHENARIAAEGVNSTTLAALGEAWSGVPRTGTAGRKAFDEILEELGGLDLAEDDLTDPLAGEGFLDPAREVFALAFASRIGTLATTRATSVGQWSRREGAQQAGALTKTWISSGAANSRHADLDGETVGIGETFSNGGQWPGDPALGVDETAGCLCSLEFGT